MGWKAIYRQEPLFLFSKVGALSEEKCLPFDKNSTGLSQGEGSVVFVLQRLQDAIKDKNKIYGIIKANGSSSDGKSSSLFSPSVKGQLLALEMAYAGLDRRSVSYIECHGTGTKLGDSTELKSLNEFFAGSKIPIGSVKSLIGHTKGAAGACGLLKCLLIFQNKKIPAVKYLGKFMGEKNSVGYINKDEIELSNKNDFLRFGISSFGFGNANCHLVLDEFKEKNNGKIVVRNSLPKKTIVTLGRSRLPLDVVDFGLMASKFKIPPQSLSHIDMLQSQALLAVSEAFENSNIEIDSLEREKVSVISASCLGLESIANLSDRVRHFELIDDLNFLDDVSINLLIAQKNKFSKITEDTGPGVLNNVIAGRICNTFDFNGENFNVDCDFNSFPAALDVAFEKLQKREGIIVLIDCDEKLNRDNASVKRISVGCLVISTLDYAKQNNYPIGEIIEEIKYYEGR